jgi:hypothetical protein
MLLNVAAQIVRIQNIKISKHKCYITYSVTKPIASQNLLRHKTYSTQNKTSKYVNVTKLKSQSHP